jgi:hypothetical protein
MWIFKLVPHGTIQWAKCFGGSDLEIASSAVELSDGNFLIAGSTLSSDGDVTGFHAGNAADIWIIKINSTGHLIWQKCYGGSGLENSHKIISVNDGGFVVAGSTNSTDGDVVGLNGHNDYWLFKADSSGNIIWQKCFGGIYDELSAAMEKTSDNGFVIVGNSTGDDGIVTGNHGGFFDNWIIKIDSMGNYEWGKCLGGNGDDTPYDVKQTLDGGFIIAGYTTSNNGDVSTNYGGEDYWIVKLAPLSTNLSEIPLTLQDFTFIQNNSCITFRYFSRQSDKCKFIFYDLNGKRIYETVINISEGINYSQVTLPQTESGMYLLDIAGKKVLQREKIVLHKQSDW